MIHKIVQNKKQKRLPLPIANSIALVITWPLPAEMLLVASQSIQVARPCKFINQISINIQYIPQNVILGLII